MPTPTLSIATSLHIMIWFYYQNIKWHEMKLQNAAYTCQWQSFLNIEMYKRQKYASKNHAKSFHCLTVIVDAELMIYYFYIWPQKIMSPHLEFLGPRAVFVFVYSMMYITVVAFTFEIQLKVWVLKSDGPRYVILIHVLW